MEVADVAVEACDAEVEDDEVAFVEDEEDANADAGNLIAPLALAIDTFPGILPLLPLPIPEQANDPFEVDEQLEGDINVLVPVALAPTPVDAVPVPAARLCSVEVDLITSNTAFLTRFFARA